MQFITDEWPQQARNEGGQGGHNSPSAESLRGSWMSAEDAKKSHKCHTYFL